MLADPCFTALFDTLRKSPSDPRGTPSPAESFWNTKLPGFTSLEITIGVCFASTRHGFTPDAATVGGAGRTGDCTTPLVGPPDDATPFSAVFAPILFNP